ncbi:GD15292 [Drosophila simulans]|uniref:GD15292 n=1 Tax=Drosophila simulans TaxID=7240 RepID=B4NVY1_DROSI|nr:GD15292 [Drosophila simulans]
MTKGKTLISTESKIGPNKIVLPRTRATTVISRLSLWIMARMTGQRRQRLQHTMQQADDKNYSDYGGAAAAAVTKIDEEPDDNDQINFLGSAPDCRSLNDSYMGGN